MSYFIRVVILLFASINLCQAQKYQKKRRGGNASYTVTRIEERGEDFSKRSTENLMRLFKQVDFQVYEGKNHENKRAVELRKAAQVLGDRYIEGTFKPTAAQQKVIDKAVDKYIDLFQSASKDDYSEARGQIIRFGHMSVPTLLEHLEDKDRQKFLFVGDLLIDIQTEEIIQTIIAQAKKNKDEEIHKRYIQILTNMNMRVNSSCNLYIPNRTCTSKSDIMRWYSKLVLPALEELKRN